MNWNPAAKLAAGPSTPFISCYAHPLTVELCGCAFNTIKYFMTTIDTLEIQTHPVVKQQVEQVTHPLDKFSLRGKHEQLAARKLDQVQVLKGVALLGEATVLYAEQNTGKTLITFAMLMEAVKSRIIKGDQVYYINVDDSFNGAVDKLGFAQEYGFHYLVRDQAGFSVDQFRVAIVEMIETGTAKGTVLVLDTLRKFVDLMDKSKSSRFADLIRSFVSKGGTVIALAHTNKNKGADGLPQYGGTSDIISDFDCAYIMSATDAEGHIGKKLVEFRNVKARGPVEKLVYFTYSDGSGVPYGDKLSSVRIVPEEELETMKRKTQMANDSHAIEAVTQCIANGTNQKMQLAKEVGSYTGLSRNAVFKVLDMYAGTDKTRHLWSVRVGAHGAKIYSLLSPWTPPVNTDDF